MFAWGEMRVLKQMDSLMEPVMVHGGEEINFYTVYFSSVGECDSNAALERQYGRCLMFQRGKWSYLCLKTALYFVLLNVVLQS